MKSRTLLLCLLLCLGSSASQTGVRESAGKQEVEKHPLVLEPPLPPQAQKLDPVKLREEADNLAKLAQSVPADVSQIVQGKMPKDAIDRLKRIEKISKQLRGELTR
jgi:hypothetical protein